jgi:UDP-N-acetylmuramyl pentapeptide phosphotransferase/UDP-N-acetylglucosamine-1-phosphate transferase
VSFVLTIPLAALLAALVGYAGTRAVEAAGPLAPPGPRSRHPAPTPSSGGLGIAAGAFVALIVVAVLRPESADAVGLARLAALSGLAAAAGALGLLDDVFDLSAVFKFAVLWALSVLAAYLLGRVDLLPATANAALALAPWLAVVGSGLWVFTVMNATNFMDGSNGLAGAAVGVAALALAVAALMIGAYEAALASAVLAGGIAGFLPVNAPKGRVFMGDIGSLLIGFWFAGAALMFIARAPLGAVWLPPLLMLPILTDTLLTLASRAKRRRVLFEAHREHAYQMRIDRGESHVAVALSTAARAGVFGALGLASLYALERTGEPAFALGGFIAGLAVSVFWWRRDRVGLSASKPSAGSRSEQDPGQEGR